MPRVAAISRLVCPSAINFRTRRSEGVSCSNEGFSVFCLLVFQLNPHRHGRPLTRRGMDRLRAAQNPRALGDALQSQPGAPIAIRREAAPVVADGERELVVLDYQVDLRPGRAGMFKDVVEAFLHDPIEHDLVAGRKDSLEFVNLVRELELRTGGDFFDHRHQRRAQAGLIEVFGPVCSTTYRSCGSKLIRRFKLPDVKAGARLFTDSQAVVRPFQPLLYTPARAAFEGLHAYVFPAPFYLKFTFSPLDAHIVGARH